MSLVTYGGDSDDVAVSNGRVLFGRPAVAWLDRLKTTRVTGLALVSGGTGSVGSGSVNGTAYSSDVVYPDTAAIYEFAVESGPGIVFLEVDGQSRLVRMGGYGTDGLPLGSSSSTNGLQAADIPALVSPLLSAYVPTVSLGAASGVAQLDGSGKLTTAQTPAALTPGVTSINGQNGVVTLAAAGVAPGTIAGAVDGYVATWVAANSRFEPKAVPGVALPTFLLKGVPTVGSTSAGWVAQAAVTLDNVELRSTIPNIGAAMTVALFKLTQTATTSIGTITIADGKRRGLGTALATSLAVGDSVIAKVTGIGSTLPGGNDLVVTCATTGVTFPAVGAAPSAPATASVTYGGTTNTIVWAAVANITEYLIVRYDSTIMGDPGTPITVIPADGTLTYTDTVGTGTAYTYGVRAMTPSAASTEIAAGSSAGVTYNGSVLVPTSTTVGGTTGDGHWTGHKAAGVGASVVVAATTRSDWTCDTSGSGSKIFRTSGGDGANASLSDVKITMKFKWITSGAAFYIKTRSVADASDNQRLRWTVSYGGVAIGRRRSGDPSTTDVATGSFVGEGTVNDWWCEVIDNPAASIFEIRVWDAVSGSRPGTATLASSDSSLTIASVPAGFIGFQDFYSGASKTIEIATLQVTPL